MDEQQEMTLHLSLDEIQVVFKALGFQPFHEVYEIIGKINAQVNEQLSQEPPPDHNHTSHP
ncbi:MAG: hypothetical protein IT260_03920 [Saprospiraceae bacterium]|nr:hypothetical protein [Saprospiraceae bacterium]